MNLNIIQLGNFNETYKKTGYFNYHSNYSLENKNKENNAKKLTPQEREDAFYRDYAKQCIMNKKKSDYMQELSARLQNGEKLSRAEEAYLKSNNRELYEESEEIAKASKEYEKALKEAKNKEDISKIKINTLAKFSTELKGVVNNPNITGGKKLEVAEKINKQLVAIENIHSKFVSSERFAKLPDVMLEEKQGDNIAINDNEKKTNIDENSIKIQINNQINELKFNELSKGTIDKVSSHMDLSF